METNFLPEAIYQNLPPFLNELSEPFSGREKDVVLLSSLGVLSAALPGVYGCMTETDTLPICIY